MKKLINGNLLISLLLNFKLHSPSAISLVFRLLVKPSPLFSGTTLLQFPFSGMSAINLPKSQW